MRMIAKRVYYTDLLVSAMHNGLIKVVTGIRRCGKSFLLATLFVEKLKELGVREENILFVNMESLHNRRFKNPETLLGYIEDFCASNSQMHYVIIDEVQIVDGFVDLLNSLLTIKNVDIYVTGSNSRFLSSDIATEFRGRSYEIHLLPFSFAEFLSVWTGDTVSAWDEYSRHGGLPVLLSLNANTKEKYLKQLISTVYLRDIIERNRIENVAEIRELLLVLASGVGSLTNATNLANTYKSKRHLSLSDNTVTRYIKYLEESFLIEKAVRYDIRGKQYIGAQAKYYFQDIGLRNALLSFRQTDDGHVMENVIYNELCARGYNVDIGNIVIRPNNGIRQTLEVDFVANLGSQRYYIQSAYSMLNDEKIMQEKRSLLQIKDAFKKIVIVAGQQNVRRDEDGIVTMGLYNFLSNPQLLDA